MGTNGFAIGLPHGFATLEAESGELRCAAGLPIAVRRSRSSTTSRALALADRAEPARARVRPQPPTATASASAGTASTPSRGSIARCVRPGRTRTCAISAGTSARICSSPMCAPRRARRSRGRTAIPSPAGAGCSCTTALIGDWTRVRRQVEALIPDKFYGLARRHHRFRGGVSRHPGRRRSSAIPIAATTRMLATLTDMVTAKDREPLRFTAALSNGHDLYAFRYSANDRREHAVLSRSPATAWSSSPSRSTTIDRMEAGAARPHRRCPGRQAGAARTLRRRAARRRAVGRAPPANLPLGCANARGSPSAQATSSDVMPRAGGAPSNPCRVRLVLGEAASPRINWIIGDYWIARLKRAMTTENGTTDSRLKRAP